MSLKKNLGETKDMWTINQNRSMVTIGYGATGDGARNNSAFSSGYSIGCSGGEKFPNDTVG